MKRHYAIARLELVDILADFVHDTGNVVARVACLAHPLGEFPVLWVGAAHDDFDDELVIVGKRRDGRVRDGHCGPWLNESFLHFVFLPLVMLYL